MSQIAEAIRAAGFDPYSYDGGRTCSLTAKAAQLLDGRTHYFSPGTCRFHHARVVLLRALCDGAVLGAVESVAANYENTRRVFRPVFFGLDGYVTDRPALDDAYPTKAAAVKAFWAKVETLSTADEVRAAIARVRKESARRLEDLDAAAALLAA